MKSDFNCEVLAPAGDFERFSTAIEYGADAVYMAGKEFGMRTSSNNFDLEELKKATQIAHNKGVKVYITCNTLPSNKQIETLPEYIKNLASTNIDAIIVADIGVLDLAKKIAPNLEVHISTQAGVVNFLTARTFHEMGAKRVVLARELTLEEICEIRDKTNKDLELEAFVHGSMCVSFSGRCLISNYLTARDANRGDCAQPCRWKYNLVEENRPGNYMPILEDNGGTYFFNSRDLCMIEHIPQVLKSGVTSLKIEGRAKSAYYVAVTTNAYKQAVLEYKKMGENYVLPDWIKEELNKISHREYSTGFFFGKEPGQVYKNGGYIREYEVVALAKNQIQGFLEIEQRNKFIKGDILEILQPGEKPVILPVKKILDQWNNEQESAPHPMQKLFLPCEFKIKPGAFLRKQK